MFVLGYVHTGYVTTVGSLHMYISDLNSTFFTISLSSSRNQDLILLQTNQQLQNHIFHINVYHGTVHMYCAKFLFVHCLGRFDPNAISWVLSFFGPLNVLVAHEAFLYCQNFVLSFFLFSEHSVPCQSDSSFRVTEGTTAEHSECVRINAWTTIMSTPHSK